MCHRIFYYVLFAVMMSACSVKPLTEQRHEVEVSSPESLPPTSESLCVYASKLKGMAELLDKEQVSTALWRYRFRFYPGDHEFELELDALGASEQSIDVGQELKAVRRVRVSGPESCSIYEYRIATQADY